MKKLSNCVRLSQQLRLAGGLLNCLILCQALHPHKTEGQSPSDEKAALCGLSFDTPERDFTKDLNLEDTDIPFYRQNYLVRHLHGTNSRLTAERERELVLIYQQEQDQSKKQQALTEIISGHISLIRRFAVRIARSWDREDFADDLIQDTVERLTQYLTLHDPERSRVVSYIMTYIPNIMHKKIAKYISPVLVSDKYRKKLKESEAITMPIASEFTAYNPDEDDKIFEDPQGKPVETWASANESVEQIENFIMQIGGTPRQRYILRRRIFSLNPELSSVMAEKFEIHPSGVAIRDEEKKLTQKISGYLNNGVPFAGQDQIFTKIGEIIEEGNPFPVINDAKISWRTEKLAEQIDYLIQEMDNSKEQNSALKNQQADDLAKQAGLDEISLYILRHRLMEKPDSHQTLTAVGEIFDITENAIIFREKTILNKLANAEFTSPELKKTARRIIRRAAQKTTMPVSLTEQEKDQTAESLSKEMGLSEAEQHILRYRLMERGEKQQTLKTVGNLFNQTLSAIAHMQKKLLKKLQAGTFQSSDLSEAAERILLEEKQRKETAKISLDKSDVDRETVNLAKQVEDFILETGSNPLQIYILRHRVFTLYPESFHSIAEKFRYSNKQYIIVEEQKLLQKMSGFLSGGLKMNRNQIFHEVVRRIRNGGFFFFADSNEITWQSENLIRQADLNEIEAYILRYRFLEEPSKRKTKSEILKKFGNQTGQAVTHWENSALEKLNAITFTSLELKMLIERINQSAK